MPGNRPTLIGRLRVRAGTEDPLLTQLRIDLGDVQLVPVVSVKKNGNQ